MGRTGAETDVTVQHKGTVAGNTLIWVLSASVAGTLAGGTQVSGTYFIKSGRALINASVSWRKVIGARTAIVVCWSSAS